MIEYEFNDEGKRKFMQDMLEEYKGMLRTNMEYLDTTDPTLRDKFLEFMEAQGFRYEDLSEYGGAKYTFYRTDKVGDDINCGGWMPALMHLFKINQDPEA